MRQTPGRGRGRDEGTYPSLGKQKGLPGGFMNQNRFMISPTHQIFIGPPLSYVPGTLPDIRGCSTKKGMLVLSSGRDETQK